jgi:hypothetical protein
VQRFLKGPRKRLTPGPKNDVSDKSMPWEVAMPGQSFEVGTVCVLIQGSVMGQQVGIIGKMSPRCDAPFL